MILVHKVLYDKYLQGVPAVPDGAFMVVDRKDLPPRFQPPVQRGPGAELKRILAKFGIHASPTCQCNKMAAQMNVWGPDESLQHIEEIVDVMEGEARKRGLPFLRAAGRVLVRKAIRNSRGNSQ